MPRRLTIAARPSVSIRNAPGHANRGINYGRTGEYAKAIDDCSAAIRLNPEYADAYFNRGLAFAAKGEYKKAVADYTEAIRLNPKDAGAYVQPGHGLRKAGRKAQGR